MSAWPEPKDPLDRLERAVTKLVDMFGLYVAPVLREQLVELDPDVDDSAEQTGAWICRLTRALVAVAEASEAAFCPEARGARDDAATAVVKRAELQARRQGVVLGAAQERMSRIEIDGVEGEVRAALRRMGRGGVGGEPWERALW